MAVNVTDRRYPDYTFDRLHVTRFILASPAQDTDPPFRTIKAQAKIAAVEGNTRIYLPDTTLKYHAPDFNTEAVTWAIMRGQASDPVDFVIQNRTHLAQIDARHEAGDIGLAEAMAWFEYCMGLLFTMNGSLSGFEGVE